MSKSRPWMPLYINDYLGATRHLSTEEHGAYLLLIMHYWQAGSIPKEDEKRRRITGITQHKWSKIKDQVLSFFSDDGSHKRIDAELKKAHEISDKRAEAGRKRAANAEQMLPHAGASSPSPSPSQDSTPPTPLRGECVLSEFEKARKTAQRKASANASRKKAPPRVRIPIDFAPDEKTRECARGLQLNLNDWLPIFERSMRNKGERVIDWQLRLRDWLGNVRKNEQKFAARGFGFGAPDEDGRPCIGIGDDGLPRYRDD